MEYKGNECQICGYDKIKYLSAFDFHHRDPSQKDFSLASKGICKSYKTLIKEVDKCDLLCGRCHQEIHDEEHWEERKRLLSVSRRIITKEINCLYCQKKFKQKRKEQKYCCRKCGREGIKTIPKYNIELLEKDFKELGYKKVMKKYNLKRSSLYRLVNI